MKLALLDGRLITKVCLRKVGNYSYAVIIPKILVRLWGEPDELEIIITSDCLTIKPLDSNLTKVKQELNESQT